MRALAFVGWWVGGMLRRLGPRGDGGAGFAEYAGLVVLAALILGALWAVGIPSKVETHVSAAMCHILGGTNCGKPEAGGQNGNRTPGAQNTGGQNGDGRNGNGQGNGNSQGNGGGTSLADLQKNAANAQKAADSASSKYGNIKQQIIDLLKDFIGITDIENCITKGSISSCLWAAFDVASWIFAALKIAKFAKAIKDAIKLWKVFNKGRKVIERTKSAAKVAKQKLIKGVRRQRQLCAKKNSFGGDTPVLLASGRRRPIRDVRVGDRVMATDPRSGVTRAERVTDLIRGHRAEPLVRLQVAPNPYGLASETITATAHHRFWSPARHAWTDARDLRPGDRLKGAAGGNLLVVDRHAYRRTLTAYNLTVANMHTYYVGGAAGAVLVHNDEPDDDVCDAAFQGASHIYDEIARGKGNHKIPGIGSSEADIPAMERYLDDVMKRPPGYHVRSGPQKGAQYWYDESKQYLVYKKNEYSGGGRQMTPKQWDEFKKKLADQENG